MVSYSVRGPGLASNANLDPLIGVCNLVGTGFAVKGWKEPMQLQFVGSLFKFKFVHSIIFRVSYIYIYIFSVVHTFLMKCGMHNWFYAIIFWRASKDASFKQV